MNNCFTGKKKRCREVLNLLHFSLQLFCFLSFFLSSSLAFFLSLFFLPFFPTCHKIYPFKVYNSVALNILRVVQQSPVFQNVPIIPKRNSAPEQSLSTTLSPQPLETNPLSVSVDFLLWTFHRNGIM